MLAESTSTGVRRLKMPRRTAKIIVATTAVAGVLGAGGCGRR